MKALIDGDILRYEVGFASETGWQTEGESPPWWYVQNMFDERLERILNEAKADSYTLYLSGKTNFRYDIAKTKVYKGTRKTNKPEHFDNLTAYIKGLPNTVVTEGIEADDAMAIEQVAAFEVPYTKHLGPDTIICSRDKDLRQVPGWHYGWEIGAQPSFGPRLVDNLGWIELDRMGSGPKIKGGGFKFFCSQLLTGDTVDNIPGLPKCGPVAAFDIINSAKSCDEAMSNTLDAYSTFDISEEYLLEQGRLLWLVRRYNEDGSPEMWEIGQYE